MKVLSVKNPYSFLICCGLKDVENRTWNTNYRGEILIHSSGEEKNIGLEKEYMPVWNEIYKEMKYKNNKFQTEGKYIGIDEKDDGLLYLKKDFPEEIEREYKLLKFMQKYNQKRIQSIIGIVNLKDIQTNSDSKWAQKNTFHWILEKPYLFKNPINYIKGKLNIWDYEISKGEIENNKINLESLKIEDI